MAAGLRKEALEQANRYEFLFHSGPLSFNNVRISSDPKGKGKVPTGPVILQEDSVYLEDVTAARLSEKYKHKNCNLVLRRGVAFMTMTHIGYLRWTLTK